MVRFTEAAVYDNELSARLHRLLAAGRAHRNVSVHDMARFKIQPKLREDSPRGAARHSLILVSMYA